MMVVKLKWIRIRCGVFIIFFEFIAFTRTWFSGGPFLFMMEDVFVFVRDSCQLKKDSELELFFGGY